MSDLVHEPIVAAIHGNALRAGDVDVIQDYRRQFGDNWQPAPLLVRLAAEGRGFHDSSQ